MLQNPPDGAWLSWRRTLDGQGYSPLSQVNRGNVGKLRLAWAMTMHEGSNQATPLVHEGVMFLTHPNNKIQAIDAATGDLIWEYAYSFPPEARTLGGPTRNIALYGNRLFLATYDAAIVAIDTRTGKEVWRTQKADYTQGYTHTAGPLIAGGVVVSGINGCERFKKGGCFITGHDPETG
jgi:alcohol dehydrogenase (cytochrome c)